MAVPVYRAPTIATNLYQHQKTVDEQKYVKMCPIVRSGRNLHPTGAVPTVVTKCAETVYGGSLHRDFRLLTGFFY